MVREVDEGETGRIEKYASAGKVRGLFRFVSSLPEMEKSF